MNEIKIGEIIKKFDVFLLDIFGLIHDGVCLYHGAIEMLREIKKAGKISIFISNAPRNVDQTAKRLEKFGITSDLYSKIYTPGQLFYDECMYNAKYTGTYFAFGGIEDIDLINGTSHISRTESIEDADFIIAFGMFDKVVQNSEINNLLKRAKERNLPMVCINPDKIVRKQKEKDITEKGLRDAAIHFENEAHTEILCAGYIAALYEEISGHVEYYGKPYSLIYEIIFKTLTVDKANIIALGDSFETDICGANFAKIASGLVLTGIHSNILYHDEIQADKLEHCIKQYNAKPDFILKNLS